MKGLRSAPAPTSGMLAALAKSTATSSPSLKPSVTSVTLLLLVPTVICLGLKVFPWRDQTKRFPGCTSAFGSVTVIPNDSMMAGSGIKRSALFGKVKIFARSNV